MKPWLSVIIPSYAGERWIAHALDSIVLQHADGLEVILVDGGPTGAARQIAETYSSLIDLVIFDRHDLASWHSKTNFGVQMARAEHLCWLGVDDVWLQGRVAAIRDWLGTDPSVMLHLAASAIIGKSARVLGTWHCPLPSEIKLDVKDIRDRLLIQNFVAAPAPVFRRDAWIKCGGLDETLWYTADWDIWLKLIELGSVMYHDDVTIGFRIHADSLTVTGSRNPEDFLEQMRTVVQRHGAALMDSAATLTAAEASIRVNLALALASQGQWRSVPSAFYCLLRLGPAGLWRYVINSRIHERLFTRMRARLSGDF